MAQFLDSGLKDGDDDKTEIPVHWKAHLPRKPERYLSFRWRCVEL